MNLKQILSDLNNSIIVSKSTLIAALQYAIDIERGKDSEVLSLHTKLAGETLRADQGWDRYEQQLRSKFAIEDELLKLKAELAARDANPDIGVHLAEVDVVDGKVHMLYFMAHHGEMYAEKSLRYEFQVKVDNKEAMMKKFNNCVESARKQTVEALKGS